MTTLSDTQLILLSAAAARDDYRVVLPDRLRGGAADRVLSSLHLKGLIEPLSDNEPQGIGLATRDPTIATFRITRAGLIAIHVDRDNVSRDEGSENPPTTESNSHSDASNVVDTASPTQALSAPQFINRHEAGPRSGSKLSKVVTLLGRPDGASVDELIAETGWLPHTTRATLSVLRKKGYPIVRIGRGAPAWYRLDTAMRSATPTAQAVR